MILILKLKGLNSFLRFKIFIVSNLDGVPTALMEEHAKSGNKLHSNGEMKCPNELEWTGADGQTLEWTCDEAREDGKTWL